MAKGPLGRHPGRSGGNLAEIAIQSGLEITLDEGLIPVRDAVRGLCEILGFDPLFLANVA